MKSVILGRLVAPLSLSLALVMSLQAAPAVAQESQPAAEPAEYALGPGDTVHIQVYQSPDLSLDARLSDGGVISYPLLGAIRLGGLSVGAAERLIAEGLVKGDFVKNPQVTVVLMQARGSQVSVLGQVTKAGRYPLEQGGMRLSDVLALAGGPIPNVGGDVLTIVGTRNGHPFRQRVDMQAVFSTADRKSDLIVQGNDVIYVERAPQIYIYGEVQHPGALLMGRGMTLLQGLASGGGLTPRGTEKGIRVHRRGSDGKTEILQPSMDEALQDGDVIYVRESLF